MRIRIYLEKHPEVFTQEFCEYLAESFLNLNIIRKTIKEVYPEWVRNNINDFYLLPEEEL